jgi:plasmid stabilization system protein ParE
MKVIWSAASVRHLQEVVDYLQGESAEGAIVVRRRILDTARRIGQMPYSGRIGRIEGTREAVVPRSTCVLVYQVSAQAVEILGV